MGWSDGVTERRGDRETGRLGDEGMRGPGDEGTRGPGDREMRGPGDWETGGLGDEGNDATWGQDHLLTTSLGHNNYLFLQKILHL